MEEDELDFISKARREDDLESKGTGVATSRGEQRDDKLVCEKLLLEDETGREESPFERRENEELVIGTLKETPQKSLEEEKLPATAAPHDTSNRLCG